MRSLCANVFSKSTKTISNINKLCQKSYYQTEGNHIFITLTRLADQVQRTSIGHRKLWTEGDQGSNISYTLWKPLPPHYRCGTAQRGQKVWLPFHKNVRCWWVSFWMPAFDTWHELLWMMSICDSSNFTGSTLSLTTVCFNKALQT